ncbi:MAG: hypothetical protein SGJ09_03765 [Phycisphaerae bacterium]|nr:hypothetical protein [Phycisphaerae bacterium]
MSIADAVGALGGAGGALTATLAGQIGSINCYNDSALVAVSPVCVAVSTHCNGVAQGTCSTQRCKVCQGFVSQYSYVSAAGVITKTVDDKGCDEVARQLTYRCRWYSGGCICDQSNQINIPDEECEIGAETFQDASPCPQLP